MTEGSAGTSGAAGAAGTYGECGQWSGAGNCTFPTGDAGTTGAAGTTGDAGTIGAAGTSGDAGTTGSTIGNAGTTGAAGTIGSVGMAGASGTTGIGGASAGGMSGSAGGMSGTTGVGGNGGTALPACLVFGPMFGVCVVNDKDGASASTTDASSRGAATIEAVGSGAAPASCQNARVFGMHDASFWWFQARAADNRLWTVGVRGLSNMAPVRKGDVVTLDFDWRVSTSLTSIDHDGHLQVADAAGTPLLWAGADAAPSTWISFTPGDEACAASASCMNQKNVVATVQGSSMTLHPYGAATISGYFLQVTTFFRLCGDYAPPFEAAAIKNPTN